MMWMLFFVTIVLCLDISVTKDEQVNVFGKQLEQCSQSPMTGYYRTGSCEWQGSNDYGVHAVCAQMTSEFLDFTRSRGNDLSSPSSNGQFPGLRAGDRWCLCAGRWKEALEAKAAPPVLLRATHRITLQHVKLEELRQNAVGKYKRRRVQKQT